MSTIGVDIRDGLWRDHAACAGMADAALDPWFPDEDMPRRDQTAAFDLAREVCDGCPVMVQCLEVGLALIPLDGAQGMYGGMTPAELRAEARRRGIPDRTVAQHGTRARRVSGCDCGPCKRAHAEYVTRLRHEAKLRQRPRGVCGAETRSHSGAPCQQPASLDGGPCRIHAANDQAAA